MIPSLGSVYIAAHAEQLDSWVHYAGCAACHSSIQRGSVLRALPTASSRFDPDLRRLIVGACATLRISSSLPPQDQESVSRLLPIPMLSFLKRHKILKASLLIILALILVLGLWLGYRSIGPYRSYRVHMMKPTVGPNAPLGTLQVGVAKRDITPPMDSYDPWVDADNNGKFEPSKGDTYTDKNGNGTFDFVWIAGFGNNRPAKGVHDRLWARAIAFRNNGVTIVMVSLDSIGIFYDRFIAVRKMINPSLNIDHVMFSSLHDHEAPDARYQRQWGKN